MSDDDTDGPYNAEGETVYATDPETGDIEAAVDEDKPKYKQKAWLYTQYHRFNKSQTEMAEECGVSSSTIGNWMNKFNIETRDLSTATSIGMGSDERLRDEDWLRENYIEKEKTMYNMADELNCSVYSIYHAIHKYDIPTMRNHNGKDKPYTDKNWLRHQYKTLGKSTPKIADEVGVHPVTIQDWLQKNNIQTRSLKSAHLLHNKQKNGVELTNERDLVTKDGIDASWNDLIDIKKGKIVKYRNKTWLENKLKNGKSTLDISDVCDVSAETIRRWAHRHGLEEYLDG